MINKAKYLRLWAEWRSCVKCGRRVLFDGFGLACLCRDCTERLAWADTFARSVVGAGLLFGAIASWCWIL